MTVTTNVTLDRWRTHLTLVTRSQTPVQAAPLLAALTLEVDRLELLASRFREDSQISAVNRAAGQPVAVTGDFLMVLAPALQAAAATDGLVSPLLGELVDGAGYRVWRDTSGTRAVTVASVPAVAADWRSIEIVRSGSGGTVRIPPGTSLDLGATAKAWLADRMAALVWQYGGVDVIADMGGDLSIRTHGEPWPVAVTPSPDIADQQLLVGAGGLATSGTSKRAWRTADGTPAHHIIDPRTGHPADGPWVSASVWAADAVAANTASTAAIVLGATAPSWLQQRGLAALLTTPQQLTPVGGWPSDHPSSRPQEAA